MTLANQLLKEAEDMALGFVSFILLFHVVAIVIIPISTFMHHPVPEEIYLECNNLPIQFVYFQILVYQCTCVYFFRSCLSLVGVAVDLHHILHQLTIIYPFDQVDGQASILPIHILRII